MKRLSRPFLGLGKPRGEADNSIHAVARVDSDPLRLARRLRRGEIAVIDVMDLDQRTAEAIATARPAAVLNAQESISGRYPNGGPGVLVAAGIPLVDRFGSSLLALRDGAKIRLSGDEVFRGDERVAGGVRQSVESVAKALELADKGMKVQLAAFTANVMDHVARESGILLEGAGLPELGVNMRGAQVVVISTGFEHEDQLKAIRPYMRDRRPIIIAVGEGADAAMKHAYAPAVIVGRVETVSDEALTSGAEVVLHDPAGGDAGRTRIDSLGITHQKSTVAVASEDLAILLAHAGGASAIVTVGIRASLLDFLEQGKAEHEGTFLARLVAGAALVDASTVSRLYRHRYSAWTLVALVLSAFFVLGNALALTPDGAAWLRSVWPTIASWFGATS